MKLKTIALIVAGILVLLVGWVLISPFFIDTVVNEELPVNQNTQSEQDSDSGNVVIEVESDADSQADQTPQDLPQTQTSPNGEFVDADNFHKTSGDVLLLNDDSVLRFENFEATNGPDLFVYLATDESADDFISLGRLKGNVGNQNYEIPVGTDLEKYDNVLIWCQAFGVLFGSAQLE